MASRQRSRKYRQAKSMTKNSMKKRDVGVNAASNKARKHQRRKYTWHGMTAAEINGSV